MAVEPNDSNIQAVEDRYRDMSRGGIPLLTPLVGNLKGPGFRDKYFQSLIDGRPMTDPNATRLARSMYRDADYVGSGEQDDLREKFAVAYLNSKGNVSKEASEFALEISKIMATDRSVRGNVAGNKLYKDLTERLSEQGYGDKPATTGPFNNAASPAPNPAAPPTYGVPLNSPTAPIPAPTDEALNWFVAQTRRTGVQPKGPNGQDADAATAYQYYQRMIDSTEALYNTTGTDKAAMRKGYFIGDAARGQKSVFELYGIDNKSVALAEKMYNEATDPTEKAALRQGFIKALLIEPKIEINAQLFANKIMGDLSADDQKKVQAHLANPRAVLNKPAAPTSGPVPPLTQPSGAPTSGPTTSTTSPAKINIGELIIAMDWYKEKLKTEGKTNLDELYALDADDLLKKFKAYKDTIPATRPGTTAPGTTGPRATAPGATGPSAPVPPAPPAAPTPPAAPPVTMPKITVSPMLNDYLITANLQSLRPLFDLEKKNNGDPQETARTMLSALSRIGNNPGAKPEDLAAKLKDRISDWKTKGYITEAQKIEAHKNIDTNQVEIWEAVKRNPAHLKAFAAVTLERMGSGEDVSADQNLLLESVRSAGTMKYSDIVALTKTGGDFQSGRYPNDKEFDVYVKKTPEGDAVLGYIIPKGETDPAKRDIFKIPEALTDDGNKKLVRLTKNNPSLKEQEYDTPDAANPLLRKIKGSDLKDKLARDNPALDPNALYNVYVYRNKMNPALDKYAFVDEANIGSTPRDDKFYNAAGAVTGFYGWDANLKPDFLKEIRHRDTAQILGIPYVAPPVSSPAAGASAAGIGRAPGVSANPVVLDILKDYAKGLGVSNLYEIMEKAEKENPGKNTLAMLTGIEAIIKDPPVSVDDMKTKLKEMVQKWEDNKFFAAHDKTQLFEKIDATAEEFFDKLNIEFDRIDLTQFSAVVQRKCNPEADPDKIPETPDADNHFLDQAEKIKTMTFAEVVEHFGADKLSGVAAEDDAEYDIYGTRGPGGTLIIGYLTPAGADASEKIKVFGMPEDLKKESVEQFEEWYDSTELTTGTGPGPAASPRPRARL